MPSAGKNYYAVLGVPPTAKLEEIKAAFRSLARQFHPDVHPKPEEAAVHFKRINEAYETLSDPGRRRQYDQVQIASHPSPPEADLTRSGDIHAELHLTPNEAAVGGLCQFDLHLDVPCEECGGQGIVMGWRCPSCYGQGTVQRCWSLEVHLPSEIHDGAVFCLRGAGSPQPGSVLAGDLYLRICVRSDW